jgi:hypothetical protein
LTPTTKGQLTTIELFRTPAQLIFSGLIKELYDVPADDCLWTARYPKMNNIEHARWSAFKTQERLKIVNLNTCSIGLQYGGLSLHMK